MGIKPWQPQVLVPEGWVVLRVEVERQVDWSRGYTKRWDEAYLELLYVADMSVERRVRLRLRSDTPPPAEWLTGLLAATQAVPWETYIELDATR